MAKGDVEKARMLVKELRVRRSKVTGNSKISHDARELYERHMKRLVSALVLTNGPLPDRSKHWRKKLPTIIDEVVDALQVPKTKKQTAPSADYADSGLDPDLDYEGFEYD